MSTTGSRIVSVGTSSVVVSRIQPFAKRKMLAIMNNSTGGQIIYLSFSRDASTADLQLNPGGSYDEPFGGQLEATSEDIYAISNLAGGTLTVTERVDRREV